MSVKDAVVERFVQICEERGIKTNELACLSGVTPSTAYSMIDPRRRDLSIITIKKFCDGLDIINIATGNLTPADGSAYEDDFAAASSPAQNAAAAYDDLEKLAKLHEQGVLSNEEFAKIKAGLLTRI